MPTEHADPIFLEANRASNHPELLIPLPRLRCRQRSVAQQLRGACDRLSHFWEYIHLQ